MPKFFCGKVFQAPNADITSSQIFAQHGVYCKNIYSNESSPSIIKFGAKENQDLQDIQSYIEKLNQELIFLKREHQLNDMEIKFFKQIQVQDEYRERQSALTYLMKILGNLSLENIDTLGPGFDFLEKSNQSEAEEGLSCEIPKQTKAYEYLQTILEKIDPDPLKIQLKTVQRYLEENTGMYRAAVEATERMEKEDSIKKALIKKQIAKDQPAIDRKEKGLNDLVVENEYSLLKATLNAPTKAPEIKVKNQITKGTLIIGQQAKLKVKKTIYGVRFEEKKNSASNASQICISGYFE